MIPTCVGAITSVLLNSVRVNDNIAQAENVEVTYDSIGWNNIDYEKPLLMPAIETNYIPQNGYCILIKYSQYFNPVSTDNIVYSNLECAHILVNGNPINEFENTVVRIHAGYLFVYFPVTAISYTDDYFRPTLEIEAGTTLCGSILPYDRFEYKHSIAAHNKWERTTGFVRSNVTYTSIEWNNAHYSDASYPALGAKNALLLNYSANLSDTASEYSGVYVQDRNLKDTVLGENITLNNVPFKDIDGAEIRYFNLNKLWLYAPNMTVAANNDRFAKIVISSSAVFDKVIPNKSFYFVNDSWSDTLQVATFSSLAWNNIDYWGKAPHLGENGAQNSGVPGYGYVLALQYAENIGPGSTQSAVDDINMASESYDIGSHLLINGVPCKDVDGAMVGSYLTPTYLFIYFPDASLTYTDEYDRPTVEIEKDCMFYNYILPEIKLEFKGQMGSYNKWMYAPEEVDNPFSVISWNNIDYGYYGGKGGLLLSFTNYLSNFTEEANGQLKTRNLAKTNLGKNIKVNGVSLSEIDDAELCYLQQNHLWLYAPNMTVASNGYKSPQITFVEATRFFDSIIPTLQFVFKWNAWELSDEDVLDRTSFTGFFEGYNNLDMGNGYRDIILCFNQYLYHNSDKNNTNLITTNEEFANKVTLNGVPLKNVPGAYAIYMGNQYVRLMIREVDEAPTQQYPTTELFIPQDTHLYNYFINEMTFYLNSSTHEWMTVDNATAIVTSDEATFKTTGAMNQIAGMCFESRINKAIFDAQVLKYGLENISFGTYIIPKVNYKNSNASSPIEYVTYLRPSNSTYIDVPNTYKDFTNIATAESDGYYRFTGSMYNIKSSHYADGFIGIGYLTVNGRTYFGKVNDNATTFYELLVQAYNASLINSSYFDSVLSFNTTANAYELTNVSVVSSGYTVSYANKGYYSLSANKDIRTIVIDGEPHKVNIRQGDSTYFAYYNGTIDFRSSLNMSKGIGEPIYELFPDNVNSNANLNTAENVSSLNQAFGADAERIWLDVKGGISVNPFDLCDENGEFQFDPAKVTTLHNYLAQFTSKGITELTLLISGWAYDHDSPIFYKDGNWYSYSQIVNLGGGSPSNIVPNQTNEAYQAWLDANENFAYKLAKEFPEFKYVEIANEFDGGGYQRSPRYVENGTVEPIATVAKWSMDLCHSLSKGIRRAESNLRVMSPAFSCLDYLASGNTVIHPYNTKSFITNCYTYIENSDDPYTNNWFQVMNLHPYVFPTKGNVGEDSVYLWNDRPYSSYSQRSKIDNEDYDTDWLNYMNYVHNTIMGGHHDAKKSVAITEFGFSDMNGTTDSYWKYVNYNDRNNTLTSTMMTKINSLDYIETLIWFRMFDFAIGDAASAFGGCLEPNFGLIEENKTLKNIGKMLYQLWNGGSTDYSDITSYLSTMEGRN